MNMTAHNRLVSFIWSIADDCLRDVYVRGKYRDVILPMVVLRRLDALLEPSKDKVLEEVKFQKEEAGFTEMDESGLKDASGFVFYNTSEWTLQRLYDTATNSQQILQANFEDYLDGFSPNVKEIISKFKLKTQVKHMGASATTVLNRKDFGMTYNKILDQGGLMLGEEVTIEIEIEAIKKGEKDTKNQ